MSAAELAAPPAFAQRLSFSRLVPNHQIAWDSTSLGALKRCPRYYYYNIVLGYTSHSESPHLRFGIEYNDAIVEYHKARAEGLDYEPAVARAVLYALSHTWDTKLGRPWTSDEPTKNRETLIRAVVWYLDQYQDDPLETVILATGKPAVELSFRVELEMHSGLSDEQYILCGYLDRQVNFVNLLWFTDRKTTKGALDERYFNQYSPNNQISQYTFAGAVISHKPIAGIIIEAVQVGVTFARFQRAQINRTEAQLEEWHRDAEIYIRQNEAYVAAGYWPQNDTSCQQYGGCPFQSICSISPSLRQRHLDGLFSRRVWDPLLIREI